MIYKDTYYPGNTKTGLELINEEMYGSSYDGELERIAGDINGVRNVVSMLVELLSEKQQEALINKIKSSRWVKVT